MAMNDLFNLAKSITDASRSAYLEGYNAGYRDGMIKMRDEALKLISNNGEVHERASTGVDRRHWTATTVPGAEE